MDTAMGAVAGVRDRPKDKWVIRTLAKAGELPGDLIDAADAYAALLEKTHVRRSCAIGERISGRCSDPHAAMLAAVGARQESDRLMSAVKNRCRARDAEIFRAAFSFPHPSIADLRRRFGVDYRGVVRALESTLYEIAAMTLHEH